jgi:hypothetical protein
MSKAKQKTQADIDWENRTLCIDENCIGVVGPDGCCKECGKTYEGFTPPSEEPVAVDTDTPPEEEVTSVDEIDASNATETHFDDSWENRTLCSDESCIGVIGPDGRCKECGKPYKSGN